MSYIQQPYIQTQHPANNVILQQPTQSIAPVAQPQYFDYYGQPTTATQAQVQQVYIPTVSSQTVAYAQPPPHMIANNPNYTIQQTVQYQYSQPYNTNQGQQMQQVNPTQYQQNVYHNQQQAQGYQNIQQSYSQTPAAQSQPQNNQLNQNNQSQQPQYVQSPPNVYLEQQYSYNQEYNIQPENTQPYDHKGQSEGNKHHGPHHDIHGPSHQEHNDSQKRFSKPNTHGNKFDRPQQNRYESNERRKPPNHQETPTSSQSYQKKSNNQSAEAEKDNQVQGSSKYMKKSPLNDFGDMGAAVRKYAQSVPKKHSLDYAGNSEFEERRKMDTNKYRQEHGLIVWDSKDELSIPDPYENFESVPGLNQNEVKAFYDAGFQAPTPIQAQTWPIVLNNERDVVSIAKTGSGKTLAFLLPGYKKMNARARSHNPNPNVLVLAPTRELAVQIETESEKFGGAYGHQTACAYGGAPKRDQLQRINAGVSVLVATPGRLNDFLDSRQVNLSSVFYLVLDEADRMLDMGFEPQIRSILKHLPRQRQTLMFSATWPEEVRRLANDFLMNPIHIRLGTEGSLVANENIRQYLILLHSGEDKDQEIINLLRQKISRPSDSILVFVARKNTCNFVANMLNRVGISAAAMHGDRTQEFREETLAKFKNGRLPVLVATDVASRGLDVKGLLAVVNYDMPGSTEDYVHRIGRTGRAGLTGESYTFLTHSNEDVWKASSIVEVMEKTRQPIPDDVQVLINQLKDRQKRNQEQRAAEDEQFSKVLMVAEKPSVAKMIADSLSNNGRYRTRRGKSRANQIFEFIKWFGPAQQKCKIMVTSVVGHIFGLSFENQRTPDVAMLFDAPVKKVIEETSKKLGIVEHLQELGEESEYLYLWLDCDREGENIGFEVISLTSGSIQYDNVYRARFSSLTASELNYAYDNPIRPDKYSAMSVDARQELDLKIGVAFTRLMTRTYLDQARVKFRLKDQKCISYGPCQTPTLWFCVQRHKEIQEFRREKYYELSVNVNIQGKDCNFKYSSDKVYNVGEVQQLEAAVNSTQNAVVTQMKEERKTFLKPVGLNTVTLLKACSKGLGMSPTAAMHAAEHLYTSGYISYPRTETTAYSPSFDLISVLEEQANHPNWGRVASFLLHNGQVNPPVGGHDAGDHPPITPVRAASRNEITKANEWRIYDYVTRHFIASLHNNFEYTETKVNISISGYDFCFTCHQVDDRGFTFAMPWKEKSLNLNEVNLHSRQSLEGQTFNIKNLIKKEEYTKPPDYLQESELISLMDKHGIGTDASIPTHIKNVQDRHYVDICGPGEDGQKGAIIPVKKYFGKNNRGGGQQQAPRPTSRHMVPRGFGLAFLSSFEDLDNELCEPTIRSYMEKQITKIATGETEKGEVVSSNLKLFLNKFIEFRQNLGRVDRYFAPKVFENNAGPFNNGGHDGNHAGYERGGGRGGRGGRGGSFNQDNNRGGRGGSFNQDNNRGGRGGSFNQDNNRGGRGGSFNQDNNRGGRGGSFNQDNNRGEFGGRGGRGGAFNHNNNRGEFESDSGRGGGRGGRGGPFNNNRGRGFQNSRGKRGNQQSFGNVDAFKRQKTWE